MFGQPTLRGSQERRLWESLSNPQSVRHQSLGTGQIHPASHDLVRSLAILVKRYRVSFLAFSYARFI